MKKGTQRAIKKAAIKAVKKTHKSIIICFLLFLILGIGAGGATTYVLTKNDTFEIIGEKTINLTIDDTYTDEGAKAIELNKDISNEIKIEGLELVDTSKEGVYIITYTLDSKLYKNIKLYRYIVVESGENNE